MVEARQMQAIETRLFEAGMPVAALMEKVAGRIARRIREQYPQPCRVGVLVGPGHNGGDALVVARELHHAGYAVSLCSPFERFKPLTEAHRTYCRWLGLPTVRDPAALDPEVWVDGWFGFGLERPLEGGVAEAIATVNAHPAPVVAIDLPSGLHSDSGQVLGIAIRADLTLCLGLWKCGLFEEAAQPWIGDLERIDFDIPAAASLPTLGNPPLHRCLGPEDLWGGLPLPLAPDAHKYRRGHLLLIAGSRRYRGAALLAGLGARSSGVGMLTLAVPQSLAEGLSLALPEALILACPETPNGTIADLPTGIGSYDAIACGPGLDRDDASWLSALIDSDRPLLLDADALARCSPWSSPRRAAPTLVTPHGGEFRRLWPDLSGLTNRQAVIEAAMASGLVVLRKGPCTHLGAPDGRLRIWTGGSAALARGGSGDVLTGLLGGLMASQARNQPDWLSVAASGVLWHGLAARALEAERSPLGVSPSALAEHLDRWLATQSV